MLVVTCVQMVAEHHAVSGAGKLPKASGDHMRIEVGEGEGVRETLFPVFLTSNPFAEAPSLSKRQLH